jgi:hypothetical protein
LHRGENPPNSLLCKKEIATSIQAWKFLTAVVTVWGIIQLNVENIFISTSPVVFFFFTIVVAEKTMYRIKCQNSKQDPLSSET